ncbi:hypothetical protein D3C77_591120 [compost metagenome]
MQSDSYSYTRPKVLSLLLIYSHIERGRQLKGWLHRQYQSFRIQLFNLLELLGSYRGRPKVLGQQKYILNWLMKI